MKAFPSRLPVLLLCLCAVTALTLPAGLPTSSAQAADFYMIGGSGGGGGSNVGVFTEGIGGMKVGNAGAGGNTSPTPPFGSYGAGGGATFDTSGGDQSVNRALIGGGSLTKEGAGTLTLTGDNTYTGDTTISDWTSAASRPRPSLCRTWTCTARPVGTSGTKRRTFPAKPCPSTCPRT